MASETYHVHLDLNGNEIQNACGQMLAQTPANVKESQFWYDSVNHCFKYHNGTSAVEFGKIYTGGTGITVSGTKISADFTEVATAAQGTKADNALPNTTKYGATFTASLNTTDYKLTLTLKDQDGNTLGTAQVIDFPIESVVVNGSYDNTNKKIVLTLENGNTVDIPVADLVAGLQDEITSSNKLDADLVDDSTSTNKFCTASDKTDWNGKQDAISDLSTIRSGAAKGATSTQKLTAYNPALTASSGVCTWTISNTLATADVVVMVKNSSNKKVNCGIEATSSNIVITFNSNDNITANSFKATIIG